MKTSRDDIAYFKYNGRRSDEFGLIIVNDQKIISPEKNVEFTEIKGADDDFAIDLNTYKSYVKPFNCVIQIVNGYRNIAEQSQAIVNWLNSAPGLRLYFSTVIRTHIGLQCIMKNYRLKIPFLSVVKPLFNSRLKLNAGYIQEILKL